MSRPLETFVLYSNYTDRISYFDDWLDAFRTDPRLEVDDFNIRKASECRRLKSSVKNAEFIVLLHSTNGDSVIDLENVVSALKDRSCPLLSFVGNEVNIPGSPIAEKRRVLGLIEPEFIASQLMEEAAQFLWGDITLGKVISIPHALNPDVFRIMTPLELRPITVGVRGASYSALLGDTDRNHLYAIFTELGSKGRLNADISDSKLTRDQWVTFLNTCRVTISSESGSWFLERNDETITSALAWANQVRRPRISVSRRSSIDRLWKALPTALRQLIKARISPSTLATPERVLSTFEDDELLARFFTNRALPDFYGKCVSSRHFEAVGTGTVQVLLEGRYNDCLEPGFHYLQLKRDYSNLEDVVESINDLDVCQKIANQSLHHVLANHTYAKRIDRLLSYVTF